MLTVHHLGKSQSERVVWLCEELGLDYALKTYTRDRETILAPPELKALHPIGAAPLLEDGEVLLAESGAIVDYILARYGQGRLVPATDSAQFAPYLYWFHYANGTLQPLMGRNLIVARLAPPPGNPVAEAQRGRLERAFKLVDDRLGVVPFLAGPMLTAADIMIVFSLTTMRYFTPVNLAPYPNIRAYLARIGEHAPYRRAMEKGDPGMALLLD